MKIPLDTSDEASLILADYLEEYDDIDLANEVRNSVLEPNINVWCYEYCFVANEFGNYVGLYLDDYVGSAGSIGVVNVGVKSDVGGFFGVGSII